MCKGQKSSATRGAERSARRNRHGRICRATGPTALTARGFLNSRFFMDEEEKALFRSIGERLDKLDKVVAILERIEGQQIMLKKEIEQEIKDQPVVGSLASIGERLDKLDKVLTVLERIEGRQIVVKKEIEQEIKEQPAVGSFASTDK